MKTIKINANLNPSETLRAVAAELPKVEFNSDWYNGTGYLDRLCKETLEFTDSEFLASETTDGRTVVIVKSPIGNYVLFERYTDGENGIVVSNEPAGYASFNGFIGFGGSVSTEMLIKVLGHWSVGDDWVFSPDTSSNFQRALASITRPVTADDQF